MVFIYKQTNTTAQILKPDPEKVKRIFTIVFAVATVITFALSWYTTYQLQDSNIPLEGSMKYQNTKSIMIFVLNFSFLIMIILANAYSLTLKKTVNIPLPAGHWFLCSVCAKGRIYYFRLFLALAAFIKNAERRFAGFS